MPFNGSGVFQRVRNWVADATAGIKIRADYHDAEDDGFAAGLSNCIARDGQSIITQNIPFNSKRITGLADPINDQDAATKASVGIQVVGIAMPLAGGTMTGDLVLFADPDQPMEASTKQYTDARDTTIKTEAIAAAKAAADIAYQVKDAQLFAGIPPTHAGNYTTIATDAQKMICNNTGSPVTMTINGALYPMGTAISFFAYGQYIVIANTETMMWLSPSAPTTGSRTLAQYGVATAVKWTTGNWCISGNGLT